VLLLINGALVHAQRAAKDTMSSVLIAAVDEGGKVNLAAIRRKQCLPKQTTKMQDTGQRKPKVYRSW
jgi:hypothetical protein